MPSHQYRQPLAQEFHRLICRCCQCPAGSQELDKDVRAVSNFLHRHTGQECDLLKQRSAHGFTHFHDVINISFAECKEPDDAGQREAITQKTVRLLKLLGDMCRAYLTPAEYGRILTAVSNTDANKASVLHEAVRTGNASVVGEIIQQLQYVKDEEGIGWQRYAQQFMQDTRYGKTPRQIAHRIGASSVERIILNELAEMHRAGIIGEQSYNDACNLHSTGRRDSPRRNKQEFRGEGR